MLRNRHNSNRGSSARPDRRAALSAAALVVAAGVCCPVASGQLLAFSLDIGSDKSCDPHGGQGFDCGDAYIESSVLGGTINKEGNWLDDSSIPGLLVTVPTYAGTVPYLAAGRPAGNSKKFLNIDDLDWVGADLRSYGLNGVGKLHSPIYYDDLPAGEGALLALYEASKIAISFDDDSSAAWWAAFAPATGPAVPVNTGSPMTGATFGTAARSDEVVEYWVSETGSTSNPLAVTGIAGAMSEAALCADLSLNPDVSIVDDDDVDALCIVNNQTYVLFGVDHQANGGLNTATVYCRRLTPAGTYALDTLITWKHLGIAKTTDIDAMALCWMKEPATGKVALALLFSTDVNDPGTAVDESGSLDPTAIYASFMTGSNFVALRPTPPSAGLYGVDRDTDDFYQINRVTGEATSLGSLPTGEHNALAANAAGEVYYIDGTSLYKVDVSNPSASTVVKTLTGISSGEEFCALDFDSSGDLYGAIGTADFSGVFYGDTLVRVDISTGVVTTIGSLSVSHVQGIGFDPVDGKLYAIDEIDGLIELDKSTGATIATLGCSGCGTYSYSMSFDRDGTLYIADEDLLRVEFRGSGTPTYTNIGPMVLSEHVHGLASVYTAENVDAIAVLNPTESVGPGAGPTGSSIPPPQRSDEFRAETTADFMAFQAAFAAGSREADVNHDGRVDNRDMMVWQQRYAQNHQ